MTQSKASYQHFLSIQPGLEDLLIKEIEYRFHQTEVFFIQNIQKEKGGVTLECPLGTTEYLLKYLKSPTRINLEITQFRATDFPKLFKKIENFNWSKILRYPKFNISSTCIKSRLIHSDRVSETVEKSIQKYYQMNPPSPKQEALLPDDFYYPIKVRLHNDQCKISIDISQHADGSEFFKKDLKAKNAKASLRENIAFCLLALRDKKDTPHVLLDPMAGAGTIALMSKDRADDKEKVFDYLKIPYDKLKKTVIPKYPRYEKYLLNDIDSTHYNFLKENFQGQENVEIKNEDFKDLELSEQYTLFCNLPYGKRIKIDKKECLGSLFRWFQKYQKELNTIDIIAPYEWQNEFKKQGFKITSTFENGGLKVCFYTK